MQRRVFIEEFRKINDEDDNDLFIAENVEPIIYPSNYEWKTKNYLKLVERQKNRMEDELQQRESNIVLHDWKILPAKNKKSPFCAPDAARLKKEFACGPGPITWTISDIAKAGCLLSKPEIKVAFNDEQEMRRIYTLIYDVFRYKNILNEVLDEIAFFAEHTEVSKNKPKCWLILYDLYHRSFKKRSSSHQKVVGELFPISELQQYEDVVWLERVRLAASVARLRIKHSALRLSELLPYHLRDEKICCRTDAPVACWVNIKKVKNFEEIVSAVEKILHLTEVDAQSKLECDVFKWDQHCPQFIIFHASVRAQLAQCSLVQKHKLIVQDKSFCVGPATFGKIVSDLQLSGSVIQSHVNSPKTTAYLASILSQNDNINKLLAFNAGARKKEYENYFNDLGLKNVLIFSERMCDLPPDSQSLEEAIAVFATPPNSYSAVADPIDLVCSRGGDLTMLEILTDTDETSEGRKRVADILDEQRKTLKFAMSRPQIQFVLYETHSEIDAENDQMVQLSVNEINKNARIHHATIQGKLRQIPGMQEFLEQEINNNNNNSDDKDAYIASVGDKRSRILREIVVPDCDLFDIPKLPDLYNTSNGHDSTGIMKGGAGGGGGNSGGGGGAGGQENGCYLALLQRKQITRMDNKYMIAMAESRGVFGTDAQAQQRAKNRSANLARKKGQSGSNESPKSSTTNKKRFREIELDRIAAPTISSVCHARMKCTSTECPRHSAPSKTANDAKVGDEQERKQKSRSLSSTIKLLNERHRKRPPPSPIPIYPKNIRIPMPLD